MNTALYCENDLQKKLSKDFHSLNALVTSSFQRHGKTAACNKAIQQYTGSFYRKVALNYRFRKIREYLLSRVNKSGKEYSYELYNDGGCKAKLYAIPSASIISPKDFSSTVNSLIVDYGSVQIDSKGTLLLDIPDLDRTLRLTQGESCVGMVGLQTIRSLRATTQVAIFFCICYQH